MTEIDAEKTISKEDVQEFQESLDKTGILYMSWVPPFMKPQKIRQLLSRYGEIGRIYLAPEDDHKRKKRLKHGGNKRRLFTEGWIEFKDKKIAKTVAQSLNALPIGGRKRNFHQDDLWTLKYLPKFKWNHLTERIAHEKASREQRLRTEISQAARENKAFTQSIHKAKMLEGMKERKTKRAGESFEIEAKQFFKQRKVVSIEDKKDEIPASVKQVIDCLI